MKFTERVNVPHSGLRGRWARSVKFKIVLTERISIANLLIINNSGRGVNFTKGGSYRSRRLPVPNGTLQAQYEPSAS